MLRAPLVLSCLLATQFVDSKPQWQYWPQLYQPYHYTQYALPIYSQNYLTEAAVTGHFPGTNQKVTPYWGAVNFDSPRYFKAFCEEKNRKFGSLFNDFDENGDGQVTFGEVNRASQETNAAPMKTLETAWDDSDHKYPKGSWIGPNVNIWTDAQCDILKSGIHNINLLECQRQCEQHEMCSAVNYSPTEQNGDCILRKCGREVPPPLGSHLDYKGYYIDSNQAAEIKKKIKAIILPKFNVADADNDQSLDMNEFANYATVLYDAIGFYEMALRDRQTANPNFDDERIAQNEWDCTHKQIKCTADGAGCTGAKCTPHAYDQTKIDSMVGNNGDNMLDFAEYRNVMLFYKNVARQQGTWPQYC